MTSDLAEVPVSFILNGKPVSVSVQPGARLSEVLREDLGARDVKVGCEAGDCGACSVLVDEANICACLMPVHQAQDRHVTTLKGLVEEPLVAKLKANFAQRGAAQCGICTPGMLVSAVALLKENAQPNHKEVEDALSGVLCRCTGYRAILDAVVATGQVSEAVAHDEVGHVGASIERVDGGPKLAGSEVFGDDLAPPNTLVIKVIRSPYARAAFEFGDIAAFIAAHDFVTDVITAKDIKGQNSFGVIPGFLDQPVFAEQEARFRGEAVAAVIGDRTAMATFAPQDFPVRWTELASVDGCRDAMQEGATQLHGDSANNVMCRGFVQKGDAQSALEAAYTTVKARFKTGFVEHAYIEPEAGFATWGDGKLTVHACTQAPVMDLETLERITGLEQAQIRVVPLAAGGGFGSKLDVSVQPILALAAMKTGKPVRLTYSRKESMQSTTKRHPADISLEIGATKDGAISGMQFEGHFNTGAYASWGPTVANRVPVHASGPYVVSDYVARSCGVYTNNPPAGAFRGFGVPQAAVAQESLFDELADKLGMDRLEFRIRNALVNGAKTVCGQVFQQGVGIKACLEALRSAWKTEREIAQQSSSKTVKLGVGVAAGWYGCGNTSLPNPSTIRAGITKDGRVVLHQGATDIGQGANTVITQIFATALGVNVSDVSLIGGDTDLTPDAGKTSASRQTYVSGEAARRTGASLRAKILERVNASDTSVFAIRQGNLSVDDGDVRHEIDLNQLDVDPLGYVLSAEETYDPPTKPLDENGQGEPYAQFGYAAHLTVVSVDMKLGVVTPLKFIAAHDVGKAINPMLVEGQVHGGIAQGLGMALMEEYIPGRTENLHDYLIPTMGDVPPIDTLIIEEPDAHGPFGAKGLGEHVLIPTAPAILNAIADATGARVRELPATPSRVFEALAEVSNG